MPETPHSGGMGALRKWKAGGSGRIGRMKVVDYRLGHAWNKGWRASLLTPSINEVRDRGAANWRTLRIPAATREMGKATSRGRFGSVY